MAETGEAPKPLCFVIGPIGKEGGPARKHADLLLHTVIKQVLEADEFGYRVKRADEDADPGMISDRMISDILHSELVVADLTDLNPNVFYELGIRHAAEKPTIHIARTGTVPPFDNAAHRTISVDLGDWDSTQAGRARLAAFARAIKEPNYKVSNPITQANAGFKMRMSADPQERTIAQLQERVNALELRSAPKAPEIIIDDSVLRLQVDRLIQEGLAEGKTPIQVKDGVNRWLDTKGFNYVLVQNRLARPGVTEFSLWSAVSVVSLPFQEARKPTFVFAYQIP